MAAAENSPSSDSQVITRDGHLTFRNLSIEQGLSQSSVQAILQDDRGYMWFGTEDGLNRYDGYTFQVYKHDPEDPESLASSNISTLYQDGTGMLWVGTNGGGLERYDRDRDQFVHYRSDATNPHSLSNDTVLAISEDGSGNLWVGTNGGGLNRYDRQNDEFIQYHYDSQDPDSLSGEYILGLYQDPDGTLWVATERGLDQYDDSSDRFLNLNQVASLPVELRFNTLVPILVDRGGLLWVGTSQGVINYDPIQEYFNVFQNDPNDPNSLSDDDVRSILEDENGVIWIGTYGGGLNLYNPEDGKFTRFQSNAMDPTSLSSDFVYKIYQDRSGLIWIGMFGGGVSIFNRSLERFAHYYHDPNDLQSLSENSIFDLHEDHQGYVWIATYGGGLNRFDPQSGLFSRFIHNPNDPGSLVDDETWSVYEDHARNIWVGTNSGLDRLRPGEEQFIHYAHQSGDPNSLSNNVVLSIIEDRENNLWVGTDGGLNRYDPQGDRFYRYLSDPSDPNSLSSNAVWCLFLDHYDELWIGTNGGGLNRLDPQTQQFIRYEHNPDDPTGLSNDTVLAIYQDQAGTYWVGTWGGGLNRFDPKSGAFTQYTENDGLPNNVVYGILEDGGGNLWLSTNYGLSRFDPQTETFKNYTASEGLQSNEFNLNSHLKARKGAMYFGGISGLTEFYPYEITDNPNIPPVSITALSIYNQLYSKDIADNEAISLSYRDNFLSFDFATLDYVAPDKNQYAYKMEGLDQDWIFAGTRRHADYPNLRPGSYRFQVKGANSDGVWNETGTSIHLTIQPPIWGTWWFQGGLLLLLIGIAIAGYRFRVHEMEARRVRLEQQVDDRTRVLAALNEIAVTVSQSLDLDETLYEALDKIMQLLKVEGGGVYLLDEEQGVLSIGAQRGLNFEVVESIDHLKVGEGFSGRVVESGEPLVVDDLSADPRLTRVNVARAGFKSVAIVPLITKRKVLGTLFVLSYQAGKFNQEDLSSLISIGYHVGIAVENARLYEDTSNRLAQLGALQQTNRALVSTLELDDLLNLIVEQAVTLLQAKGGILNLVDWENMEDEVVACVGSIGDVTGQRGSLHASLSGWVTIHNQPEISNNLHEDQRVDRRAIDDWQTKPLHNAAIAPMAIKDQVVGTLVVVDKLGGTKDFDRTDLDLLTAFANQAATAIENARLYNAEHRRAEQFRVIAEVGRQFAFIPALEAVLDQVTKVIQRAFGYYHVGIGLVEDGEVNYRVGAGELWDNPSFQFQPNRLKIGEEGVTGWVASTGKPLLVPDVTKEPRYMSMEGSETKSELIVPVIVKGEVIGVLDAQSDKLNAFDESDLAVLQALAHQAGAAIENARLYERSQRLAVMEERSRLARDLHDAVTQTLFSASLMAEALPASWESDPEEGRELLADLRGLSRGALAEMRTLLLELRPAALVETNLEDLLRQLVEAASGREGIPINLVVEGKSELPPDVHIALYRIAQEALNNLVKHARASQATVRLCFTCEDKEAEAGEPSLSVLLSVIDDGRGFDIKNIPQDRLGLGIMHERAQAIGATLTLDSQPGEGTQVTVLWVQMEAKES